MRTRTNKISENECFIYQLIESCLKLDLDKHISLKVINLILEHYWYLFYTGHSKVTIEKMDYRNYRRYVNNLMVMNPILIDFYNQYNKSHGSDVEPIKSKKKPKDIRHLENLMFLLSENDDTLPYKKYKMFDTDDLVLRALIQIDKNYIF